MSETSADNQDLQTYLDSFNKEIESVTLSADAVDALAADAVEEGEDVAEDESYYYFEETKPNANQKPRNKSSSTITLQTEEDETGYVVIMDKSKNKLKLQIPDSNDNDDPDDPHKEIYEFNETEDLEDDSKEFVPKIIRVKPTSSSTDPNAAVHRCTHCDYTTHKRFLLSRHMKGHSDYRPYKCAVCERGFKTSASLLNHVNTHLGNKPHACNSCEMRFTTSGELVRHVRYRHTGEKPHKCTECDYSSVELSKLRRHMRCHTGERPYQCPHCTYASPDTFKLKRHLRTHTGEKPYECDICHARFTQSNTLKAHRPIHSVGDKPVFPCSLCPTTCSRKTDLRLHIKKLHHSDHPIECKRCGKNLPDRYSYKVHLKTHEGEKCFQCEFCPYASVSMRHLESHMLIHTDEKPFVCANCDLAFRQRQLLKRHNNLYHNKDYVPPEPRAKLHKCPHCKRGFTHKGNLIRHMEMHDPESNAGRAKMKLKIGRLTRVQMDSGSISSVNIINMCADNDNYAEADTDEDYEIIETVDDDIDQKPVITQAYVERIEEEGEDEENNEVEYEPEINTVSVKKESNGKEFMSVEVNDGQGQQYMVVEVMQCDEDDEDDDDDANCVTVEHADDNIIELPVENMSKVNADNCFGFEEDENDDYENEDVPDNKETIQLLQIIN